MSDGNTIPKLPVRELPKPEERRPLTKWEFATLYLEQQGKCARCSARLEKGQTIDEHLQPLDALGSNDLSNRALYCRPCASEKTSKQDRPRRDHGRKVRGETHNGPKRKIHSRSFLSLNPRGAANFGGLKSRGFDKRLRKRMDGKVVPR